ncbi:hypothetical protein ON010_g4740 [Phytophthora cinnamomi]|nr:hypothetical protein ON010_g4740 [Phytophthora cinnamomi]
MTSKPCRSVSTVAINLVNQNGVPTKYAALTKAVLHLLLRVARRVTEHVDDKPENAHHSGGRGNRGTVGSAGQQKYNNVSLLSSLISTTSAAITFAKVNNSARKSGIFFVAVLHAVKALVLAPLAQQAVLIKSMKSYTYTLFDMALVI